MTEITKKNREGKAFTGNDNGEAARNVANAESHRIDERNKHKVQRVFRLKRGKEQVQIQ